MIEGRRWRVRLAASAEADYRNILRWTAEHFGTLQALRYAQILESAIEELTEGPEVPGSRELGTTAHRRAASAPRPHGPAIPGVE